MVKPHAHKYIKSPLNYIGGKHKILPMIMPYFPNDINTFVDLFAGGFNVGINAKANKIICNDHISYIIDLFKFFKQIDENELLNLIHERINFFGLSTTNEKGYLELREEYNRSPKSIDLFMLTCYSFNHQIRFNNKHQYNNPFGKNRSSYNKNIESNLLNFINALKNKNIVFQNDDFLKLDLYNLGDRDFVYCDPPYLITNGSYNDGKRGFKDWTEKEELELLYLLDDLNQRNIKFALSNVLQHKGYTNEILIEWARKYSINYIDKEYSNCNYQFKAKNEKTVEVLITNYNRGFEKWDQMELLTRSY